MTEVQNVLSRATSMVGRGTIYWAGSGGLDPSAASPAQTLAIGRQWPTLAPEEQAKLRPLAEAAGLDVDDPALVAPACDCSGFVCWALGISRHPEPQRWINTDSIWGDATSSGLQFRKIERATLGCLVVYPQAGSGEKFGHIALVTEVTQGGRAARIVHCSAANLGSVPPDAIKITTPEAFERQPKSVYAWFKGLKV